MHVVPFSTMKGISRGTVGSKAWNLSDMFQNGLPVPPGFVVTNRAFQLYLEANRLLSLKDSQAFKESFFSASLPQLIVQEIREQYSALRQNGITTFAVRSSSSMEDLCSASFAGQYDTFLNIRSFEDVLIHMKQCWYSFFSFVVQEYAEHHGISLDSHEMGVIIQGMIHAEVSGVIFSKHPVTNNKEKIVINASYGLGEAVVSGLVTPDYFEVCKKTGLITKEIGLKEIQILPGQSGTKTLETSKQEQQEFCLNDEIIQELVLLTQHIENRQKCPVDIEFAIQDGKIYLLQVRPITT